MRRPDALPLPIVFIVLFLGIKVSPTSLTLVFADVIVVSETCNHLTSVGISKMSRPRRIELGIRIILGQNLYGNAVLEAKGERTKQIFLEDDKTKTGAGTPSTPTETDRIRTDSFVEVGYFRGKQTAVKQRLVPVSPAQALEQLSPAFDRRRKNVVTKLAMKLIVIVHECELLRGFSAICVAGACILAAESALAKTIMYCDGLVAVGVNPKAICVAFKKLKTELTKNLQVRAIVVRAKGNPCRFPGKLKIPSNKTVVAESVSGMLRTEMIARGRSHLRTVTNADEIASPAPRPKIHRFYAALQEDDIRLALEEDVGAGKSEEFLDLPAFDYAFAYTDETESQGQAVEGCWRPDKVFHYGMALGNLVM